MTVLVTGTAGFVGSHVALALLERGDRVIGLDNLNDYYDVSLKRARLARFEDHDGYQHVTADLADRDAVETVFREHRPTRVINLAAQAGVRYAAENPHVYVASNVTGFLHVLEGCRQFEVEHLVFASTSSVYGANTSLPFSESQPTEHPLTLYAATKKSNEMMAHSYANLYGFPCTGLRFFTIYGPWGRPDMALFIFTRAILEDRPVPVFNHGRHSRSFTYIDDAVRGVLKALDNPASADERWDGTAPNPSSSRSPYRIFNLGNPVRVPLLDYIQLIEQRLGRKARLEMLPMQPGDVPDAAADVSAMAEFLDFTPAVDVETGVARFVDWYRSYYAA